MACRNASSIFSQIIYCSHRFITSNNVGRRICHHREKARIHGIQSNTVESHFSKGQLRPWAATFRNVQICCYVTRNTEFFYVTRNTVFSVLYNILDDWKLLSYQNLPNSLFSLSLSHFRLLVSLCINILQSGTLNGSLEFNISSSSLLRDFINWAFLVFSSI